VTHIFTCECGIRTREPFKINAQMLCAICAERVAPGLVYSKARRWYEAEQRERKPFGFGRADSIKYG
jgi:hypothetical protein